MLDNMKFRRKMIVGFGLVALLVLVLTVVTVGSSLSRNRQLEKMESLSLFQQEATAVANAFGDARESSIIVFELMEVGDSYNDIYIAADSAAQHLSKMQELSDELGGYNEDAITNISAGLAGYRAAIERMEQNEAVLGVYQVEMTESASQMSQSLSALISALNTTLTGYMNTDDMGKASDLMKNVIVPIHETYDSVSELVALNEGITYQMDSVIGDDARALLSGIESELNTITSRIMGANEKSFAADALAAVDTYRTALDEGLDSMDITDQATIDAESYMAICQQIVVAGIDIITADVNEIMNQISVDSRDASIINVAIAIAVIIFSIVIGTLISKSITSRLNVMKEVLHQVGETGNMNFTEDQRNTLKKVAETRDELGESMLAFVHTMEHIEQICHQLETVAAGDLAFDVEILGDDDTSGYALKDMMDNLNSMFADINSVSQRVAAGAGEIANSAQSLAEGATQQASTVQEITSSMNEIAHESSVSAQMAAHTATETEKIRSIAQDGSNKMDNMMSAVKEISEASQSIEKVIKVIDDIAFQTNILALNAAVEAARAGTHGKGFAVVADEVRNLASKSAEAAKETAVLIQASVEKADLGLSISHDTAESLQQIVEGIQGTSESIAQIALQSEQAQQATNQINVALDQVAQVVQHNSATSQQSAAASHEMSDQARMLQQLVARFKLRDEIDNGSSMMLGDGLPRF